MDRSSVRILHNMPAANAGHSGGGPGGYAESDAGVITQVNAVAEALDALGIDYRIQGVRRLPDLHDILADIAVGAGDDSPSAANTIIFNLIESFPGREWDSVLVPGLFEAYGLAYTGNPTPALMLSYDKWQTKAILRAADVACPHAALILPGQAPADYMPRLSAPPFIVKPLQADASEGIDIDSVFNEAAAPLAAHLRDLHRRFNQPALVEQFIQIGRAHV